MHMNDHLPKIRALLGRSSRQVISDLYAEVVEPQNSDKWLSYLHRRAGRDEPYLNEGPQTHE